MPLCAEEHGEKEGERCENAKVPEKIEKNVIGGNTAVEQPVDIDLTDALEGGEIDEIPKIMRPCILSRLYEAVAPEDLFKERYVQKQGNIEKEEEKDEAQKDPRSSRALCVEHSADIEEQADHGEKKDPQKEGAGKRPRAKVQLNLKIGKIQKKVSGNEKDPAFRALEKGKEFGGSFFHGILPSSK